MFTISLVVFIFCLLGIIIFQIAYIDRLKKSYSKSLEGLSLKLSLARSIANKGKNSIEIEEIFKKNFKKTQSKLNNDLFDLQVLVFGKNFEKKE